MKRRNLTKTARLKSKLRSQSEYRLSKQAEQEEDVKSEESPSCTEKSLQGSTIGRSKKSKGSVAKYKAKFIVDRYRDINPQIVYFSQIYEYLRGRYDQLPADISPTLLELSEQAVANWGGVVNTLILIACELKQYHSIPLCVHYLTVVFEGKFQRAFRINAQIDKYAIACLFVACKYVEMDPVILQDITGIVEGDEEMTLEQVQLLQGKIINKLQWNMDFDSEIYFIDFYAKYLEMEKSDYCRCVKILLIGMMDMRLGRVHPSLKATAAIYLNNYITHMKGGSSMPYPLRLLVGHSDQDVKKLAHHYLKWIGFVKTNGLDNYKKYFEWEKLSEVEMYEDLF